MRAVGPYPARRRPAWLSAVIRTLRRLLRRPQRTRVPADAIERPLDPLQAEAVEKALVRWVRLQKSESTPVPTRRIDSE